MKDRNCILGWVNIVLFIVGSVSMFFEFEWSLKEVRKVVIMIRL